MNTFYFLVAVLDIWLAVYFALQTEHVPAFLMLMCAFLVTMGMRRKK